MNAQFARLATDAAAPLSNVFAPMHISVRKLVSFAAAVAVTAIGVGALFTPPKFAPVSEINGTPVVNLAPVVVRPDAADLRAAALLSDADVSAAASWVSHRAGIDAGLLGTELAMPYYSFGNKFGRISKE